MNILDYFRNLDYTIFHFLNGWAGHGSFLDNFFIFTGVYLIYLIPVFLLVLWFWSKDTKKIAMQITAAGLLAWFVLSNLVGMIHFRNRPNIALVGSTELIFHRPTRSFPSDHSAFLFALAFSLWFFGYKKLSIALFIVAIVNTISRVVIGVHYPGDVIAGFILGILAAAIIYWLRKPLDPAYNFIINMAKKVKLA